MNKLPFIVLIYAITGFTTYSHAQSSVSISEPQLKLVENNVSIVYDILNSDQADKFDISLDITDSTGKSVYARSLSGDIGASVSGGPGKEINWNLGSDSIVLEAMLYFQVIAKVIEPYETEHLATPGGSPEMLTAGKNLSRSSVVMQSLLMPGLGLTRVSNGKPHWIRGAAGYSCIASSVFFSINSGIKYDAYLQANDQNERNDLFRQSALQKSVSEGLLYSAIGVWVVDFIWTMAGSKKLSKNYISDRTKGFSIQTKFSPRVNAPLLSLEYTF